MSRKHDVNKINLQIDNVDFWSEHRGNKGGMRVYWSSDIGFGELDIVKTKGNNGHDTESPYEKLELKAYTENMDKEDDKDFTEKILKLLCEYLIITE